MKILYLREQQRYTQSLLCELLAASSIETVHIIRRLKEFGVVKAVKATDVQRDMSDLLSEDVAVADVTTEDYEHFYVFTFVGVISVAGRILICYPKYLPLGLAPKEEMRNVIKVLEKYNSKEQIIRMFNNSNDGNIFNLLAVLIFLIQDYHDYGPYTNTEDIIQCNGSGEILWDKTVNESFALIENKRPYYPEMYTKKRVTDEYDYFKRLHECIVTNASKELEDAHLTDIFELESIDVSEEEITGFGEKDYILYRIENELAMQFNTHKQVILKTMYAYLAHDNHLFDIDCFSLFGTNSFNLVWEDVCQEVLGNKLHTKLCDLNIILNSKYTSSKYNHGNVELIDVIEKPFWSITGEKAIDTLIPDIVTLHENKLIIFDAKYYTPKMELGKAPKGQPGIESITKQYLYQMAYQEFMCLNGFKSIINCFILPTADKQKDVDLGYVSLGFLRNDIFSLENIKVRLLPVQDAYIKYLSGEKYPLVELKLNA